MKIRSGFTLIEVLVVLSIISVLAAVLYANFGEARTEARNRATQVELKEVKLALELYKAQEGRYPPATNIADMFSGSTPVANCYQDLTGSTEGYLLSRYSACDGADNNFILSPINILIEKKFLPDFPDPADSANENCDYIYMVEENGYAYKLIAENCHGGASSADEGIQPDNSEFARCPETCDPIGVCNPSDPEFFNSYAVYSTGFECK